MVKAMLAETDALNKRVACSEKSMKQRTESAPMKIEPTPAPIDGWEKGADAASGKVYYFKRSTGQSQWEAPKGFGGSHAGNGSTLTACRSAESSNPTPSKRTSRQKEKKKRDEASHAA